MLRGYNNDIPYNFISIFIVSLVNIIYSFTWSKKKLNRDGWYWGSSSSILLGLVIDLIRLFPIKIQRYFLIVSSIFISIIILILYVGLVILKL